MKFRAMPEVLMKNDELDAYCTILRECGASDEREMVRVPQPNGSTYLKGTYIGRVESRERAEKIRAECEQRLGYLGPWSIGETED